MQATSTREGWLVQVAGLPWLITPWGRTFLEIGQAIGRDHTDETAIEFLGGVQLAQGEMDGACRASDLGRREPPCLTGGRIRLLAPGHPGWMELHEAWAT